MFAVDFYGDPMRDITMMRNSST